MALLGELGDSMMILVTKPFSLLKRSCIFVVRSFCIVVYTWVELLRAAINIHVDIITGFMIWTFALITLPVRVLAALQRERLVSFPSLSHLVKVSLVFLFLFVFPFTVCSLSSLMLCIQMHLNLWN